MWSAVSVGSLTEANVSQSLYLTFHYTYIDIHQKNNSCTDVTLILTDYNNLIKLNIIINSLLNYFYHILSKSNIFTSLIELLLYFTNHRSLIPTALIWLADYPPLL